MTNLEMLNEEIVDKGWSIPTLAKRADIPYKTLKNKLHGKGKFNCDEAGKLMKSLQMSRTKFNQIFFM